VAKELPPGLTTGGLPPLDDDGTDVGTPLESEAGDEQEAAQVDEPPPTKPAVIKNVPIPEETISYPPSMLSRSRSTPGPGEYVWQDNVNLRKKPIWTMASPDRTNLDLMLGTWTPACSSLQPRAPDPGEYGDQRIVGRNGKFWSPKWSWERGSQRPCLAAPPPRRPEIEYKLQSFLGGMHPQQHSAAKWSVFGKDRSSLPYDLPTWTPKMSMDVRPGPGSHDLTRSPKWKATTRRGCTWGGRPKNLHMEERRWIPQTYGCRLIGNEHSRMNLKSSSIGAKHRCGCVVCPGPCRCSHART